MGVVFGFADRQSCSGIALCAKFGGERDGPRVVRVDVRHKGLHPEIGIGIATCGLDRFDHEPLTFEPVIEHIANLDLRKMIGFLQHDLANIGAVSQIDSPSAKPKKRPLRDIGGEPVPRPAPIQRPAHIDRPLGGP